MAENYSFFSNKKCEYFPCHKVSDKIAEEDFNCLFCYCPLYLKKRCPGNPVYLVTANGEKIKDCSECTFPTGQPITAKCWSVLWRKMRYLKWK